MNYPIYPNMGMPMMNMPNMPVVNSNQNNNEISKLEQRISILERKVSILEGNNNYSSTGYQML